MTRYLLPAAVLVLAAAALRAADPPAATAPAPRATGGADPFDVLYLTDARPIFLRLTVNSDGKPVTRAWDQFAGLLFARLDADKGGTLEAKELALLRPTIALLTGRTGLPPAPNGPVSREGLADYLRQNDLGPFRLPRPAAGPQQGRRVVRAGSQISTQDLDKALMELLDADKDGKLTAAELAAGEVAILRSDADENELVTQEELLRRPPALPFFVEEVVEGGPGTRAVELVLLGRKGSDPLLARRLLERYGAIPTPPSPPNAPRPAPNAPPPTKRRLTQKDLGVSREAFEALDQDGDGELDTEELARFGAGAVPEVEIALRLGSLGGGRAVEVLVPGKSPVTASAVGPAEAALEVPGVRLDLAVEPTVTFPGGGFRSAYLNRFRRADRDMNGYVDSTEFNNDPLFRELLPLVDPDGDGKVFEKELVAAVEAVEPIVTAGNNGIVSADLAEAGRGLFGLIDTDGDGRLSVRELRSMPDLIARFDRNGDGAITPAEVPRRFRAGFTRGLPSPGLGVVAVAVRGPGMAAPPRPPVGPVWFQKMDRNRDRVLTRREFVGTDEDFRRLDANGDGMIDPDEAVAAESASR